MTGVVTVADLNLAKRVGDIPPTWRREGPTSRPLARLRARLARRGPDAAAGLLLELVDLLRRLRLGQLALDRLAGLRQRVQVPLLRAGHRLLARGPLVGGFDLVAHRGAVLLLRHGDGLPGA